jgi:hypothetical protein
MSNIELIVSDSAASQGKLIGSAITSIGNRGAKLDNSIWQAAASAVSHAQQYGDCGYVGRLISAMPKGSRVTKLTAWMQAYAPLCLTQNVKTKAYKAFIDSDSEDAMGGRENWDIASLISNPWFDYKPVGEETEFGLEELLKLLKNPAEGKKRGNRTYSADVSDLATKLLKEAQDYKAQIDAEDAADAEYAALFNAGCAAEFNAEDADEVEAAFDALQSVETDTETRKAA